MHEITGRGIYWDFLFALGMVLTTMTTLRMAVLPVGIGEILLVLWIVKKWSNNLSKGKVILSSDNKRLLQFWILFFFALLLGAQVSAAQGSLRIESAVYNLIAYLFSFFICLTLSLTDENENIERKLKLIIIIGVSIFGFMLIWWKLIGPSFLGLKIVYGNSRFAGGANNPNQLALFLVPLPAFFLFLLNKRCKYGITVKTIYIYLFTFSVYIGINTGSEAFKATLFLAAIFWIGLYFYKKLIYPFNILIVLLVLILVFTAVLLNSEIIERTHRELSNIFVQLDKDGSRAYLWVQGIKTVFSSPFIGYGPGAGVLIPANHMVEAHNTFIDISIQAGLTGLLFYFVLLLKVIRGIKNNVYLTLALFCLLVFSISHFVLRQPIFWFYLVFLLSNRHLYKEKKYCAK